MTTQQKQALQHLLQSWTAHHDLRKSGAPVAVLAASRASLDAKRLRAAQAVNRLAA